MNIGEKITRLRCAANMSQEDLAELLEVSRQSVSKWEMNQALPQINKVIQLCRLFRIGTDELLLDSVSMAPMPPQDTVAPVNEDDPLSENFCAGEVNVHLTAPDCFRIGRFLGWFFAAPISGCKRIGYRPQIVIGKDTRRSSYTLEYALAAGIAASGADVRLLHVTTAACVSYVTRQEGCDCGVMICGSKELYYNNGLRLINRQGDPSDGRLFRSLKKYLDGDLSDLGAEEDDIPLARRDRLGEIVDNIGGRNRYVGHLIAFASHSYRSLAIGLDCANGAAWSIARNVFDALGAKTFLAGAAPNGFNINDGCGCTTPASISELVLANRLNFGFAFDAGAERCIAADEKGQMVDGHKIMMILAGFLSKHAYTGRRCILTLDTPSPWLKRALRGSGWSVESFSEKADGSLFDHIQSNNYALIGDRDGKIILPKYATDPDGILTAILLTEAAIEFKLPLSELAKTSAV